MKKNEKPNQKIECNSEVRIFILNGQKGNRLFIEMIGVL